MWPFPPDPKSGCPAAITPTSRLWHRTGTAHGTGPWPRSAARQGAASYWAYAERDGDTLCNGAVALDAMGAEIGHYRKIQLYGPREKLLYAPGTAHATFDLTGTKAAVLICYDIEFAPHVAALAAQGVRLILVPTANMAPFTHVVRATVPAMAANHGVSIVYANFCGTEGDLTYIGGSLIAGADGGVVAQAGAGPALIIADLPDAYDPARLSTQSTDYPSVRHAKGHARQPL